MTICEAPILLLHKKCKVDIHSTLFSEVELMKLDVFVR
jgi:hypothetical protein